MHEKIDGVLKQCLDYDNPYLYSHVLQLGIDLLAIDDKPCKHHFEYNGGLEMKCSKCGKIIEQDKPKRAVNKDNLKEFVDLYNGKTKLEGEMWLFKKNGKKVKIKVGLEPNYTDLLKPEIEMIREIMMDDFNARKEELEAVKYSAETRAFAVAGIDLIYNFMQRVLKKLDYLSTKDKEEGK